MLNPGDEFDRYVVERKLGQGGQAVVWCMRHRFLGTPRAVKLLLDPNPTTRRRLLQEGRTQERLDHPNVLPVLDVLDTEAGLALVMPMVEGPTLQDVLDVRLVEPHFATGIIRGIVSGLAAAHAAGVVHRDLKPANVLLDGKSGVLVPRIADFGLAKLLHDDGRTGTGAVFGTPGYSAPEQLQDSSRAARGADVWAVGVLAYELLTGRRPFPTTDSEAILDLADEARWDPPSHYGADVRWDDIIAQLLRRDPSHRLDLRSLAEALEEIPGELPPPSWAYDAPGAGKLGIHGERAGATTERMEFLPGRGPEGAAPTMVPDVQPDSIQIQPRQHPWQISSGALRASPHTRRIHVVSAYEDRAVVLHEVQKLRALGYSVPWVPPEAPPEDALDARAERGIVEAEEIWVFWSVAARRDARVEAELALAEHVADRRRELGKSTGRNFLIGRPLDDALLPAALDTRPGTASPAVIAAGVGVVAAMVAAWQLGRTEPGVWLALTAALAITVGAASLQWMRRPDLMLRVGTIHRAGAWLARARVPDVLGAAEHALDVIFGPRLISWQSLRMSALISSLWALPLGLMWVGYGIGDALVRGDPWLSAIGQGGIFAAISLVTTLPLFVGNIVFDYASLLVTRTVLRRVLARPTPLALALGLLADLVTVALCAIGAAYTNLWGILAITAASASPTGWLVFVLNSAWWLVTGGFHGWNLLGDLYLGNALASALTMATATLPSLVHGALLVVASLNRLGGGVPLRIVGEFLRRLADTPRGPWSMVAPAAALLAGVLLLLEPGGPPPLGASELGQQAFVTVDPAVLCEGSTCTLGCPAGEPGCAEGEEQREVEAPAPFTIQRTEVTQHQWESVWDLAEGVVPDRYGLPRNTSVFAGANLPMETVSWCRALRFANLWTAVEAARTGAALRPVYGAVADGSPGLSGCESEGAVLVEGGNGYRLPTEAEWEIAARAGTTTAFWTGDRIDSMLAVDWIAWNSGWHPHPATSRPDPTAPEHPLGLYGVHGNVSEWTWTAYGHDPDAPGGPRIFKGGSVYAHPKHSRAAYRFWRLPMMQWLMRGVRLVGPTPPAEPS